MPGTGAGTQWWMIDVLKFDEGFQAKLSLVSYALTLVGMFAFRRYMAQVWEATDAYLAGLAPQDGQRRVTIKPVGEMSLLQALGADASGVTQSVRTFLGGPVARDTALVLHSADYHRPDTMEIDGRVALSAAAEPRFFAQFSQFEDFGVGCHRLVAICGLRFVNAERAIPSRNLHQMDLSCLKNVARNH